MRRFLACNPFYLISAACLLYGSYRFTTGPAFRAAELGPVSTIFGSLQIYEMLLATTAIFLASRQIWYDSTLLVTMENMLVLIPFILVTLAVFLGTTVTWVVCGTGAVMAILRFWGLKRFIPELNMPPRALGIGLLILATNLALPFFFKSIHKTNLDALGGCSRSCWLILLPLLFASVNVLPRPTQWGGMAAQRSWLPLGFAAIWITVSAVHLWCIGYIYDLVWEISLVAPLLWVATWTSYNRISDFAPNPPSGWRIASLALPVLTTLVGAWNGDSEIVLLLAVLNAAVYAGIYALHRDNRVAFHLLLISLATLVAAMPESLGKVLIPHYSRELCVMGAIIGYVILRAILSTHPLAAVGGAVAVTGAASYLLERFSQGPEFGIQFGLVFLLVHSLAWQDARHSGANVLRIIAALAWTAHSTVWVQNNHGIAGWTVSALAVFVLGCYLAARLIWQHRASLVVPATALVVLALMPGKSVVMSATHAPAGLLAVLLAFLLFVVGTFVALNKDTWIPSHKSH
ncbi:MAG TPA: hypothetical protein VNL17_10935 [Verrucomicrobiae bacterium]|nr:hypothetical protein [Verrucomicrobiae bacterium]